MYNILEMTKYTYDPEADAFAIDPSVDRVKQIEEYTSLDICDKSTIIIDLTKDQDIISIEMLDASKLLKTTKKALKELTIKDISFKYDHGVSPDKSINILDVFMGKLGGFRIVWSDDHDWKYESIMPINPNGSFSAHRTISAKRDEEIIVEST
jgi:uncharacterized protein YuzE